MQATVHIVDQVPGQGKTLGTTLQLAQGQITARELIRRRIFEQVGQPRPPRPADAASAALVPGDGVARQGGQARPLDWQQQFALAQQAFEQQRLLVLVGQHQVLSLDETIQVQPEMEVVFLKLVPLVGG